MEEAIGWQSFDNTVLGPNESGDEMNSAKQFVSIGICMLVSLAFASEANAQTNEDEYISESQQSLVPARLETPNQADQSLGEPLFTSNPYANDGINEWAWYAIPAISQQLNLSDGQLRELNQSYGLAWSRYTQNLSAADENLAEPQRIQKQQDLTAAFHTDLTNAVANIFTDPAMRLRFNQLYLQYRWYAAFTDQFIQQQLNLSVAQQQAFRKFDEDWNVQMSDWYDEYPLNRIGVIIPFELSRRDFDDNVYSVLSPQQRELWASLIGERFQFMPDDYFQY